MPYKTEAEMCAEFAQHARGAGWQVHPEFAGYDLYLVDPAGNHWGVEAKLRANMRVLAQAAGHADKNGTGFGPDAVAVLVPASTPDFFTVASALSVHVFTPSIEPITPSVWYARNPAKRPALPIVEEVRPCGTPSPVQLTEWKTKALSLLATLHRKGSVTTRDIRHHGMNPQFWTNKRTGWLTPGLKAGDWILPPDSPALALKEQHPAVWAATLARVTGGAASSTSS